jgi:hypothetical protein
MNCLRLLEHWDRGFESHSRHGCMHCVRLFCVCVVLCAGSGLATGWSLVQGVLPTDLELRNWSETGSFMDALYSKWSNRKERQRDTCNTRKHHLEYIILSFLTFLCFSDSGSLARQPYPDCVMNKIVLVRPNRGKYYEICVKFHYFALQYSLLS